MAYARLIGEADPPTSVGGKSPAREGRKSIVFVPTRAGPSS